MKITFEKSTDNGYEEFFAISQLEIYKGKAHDELLWAEIRQVGDKRWRLTWEDSWQKPVFVESLIEAKEHVIKEHHKHTPHINGTTFDIDEL